MIKFIKSLFKKEKPLVIIPYSSNDINLITGVQKTENFITGKKKTFKI